MPIAERQPSPEAASFAGLLASLAAPRSEPGGQLEDDVVTLSYERALQQHWGAPVSDTRRAATTATDERDSVAEDGAPAFNPLFQPEEPGEHGEPPIAAEAGCCPGRVGFASSPAPEETRKRSSVTVRMSRAECAQLQQRSAEAGLTVSAYLRSCAFEIETLRAQVKQALADLRAIPPSAPWWRRIFPRAATKMK